MIYRPWKFEDILTISHLEQACFAGEAWNYQMLAGVFDNTNAIGFVAEEGGEVVGYGVVTQAVDQADLENIAVLEAYRGAGVGRELLRLLLQEAKARGVEKCFLEVRVSNLTAMRLYLSHGFRGVYARCRYYPDGEDCLVMAKEL